MTFETWVDDAQRKKKLGGPGSDANADYEYADEDPHLSFNAMTAQLYPEHLWVFMLHAVKCKKEAKRSR